MSDTSKRDLAGWRDRVTKTPKVVIGETDGDLIAYPEPIEYWSIPDGVEYIRAATGSTRWGELYGAGGRIGVGLASPDSTGRWRTTATITPVLWWRPRPGKDLADYADGKQKPGE
ncbi:MAG: hypothetical protein LRY54_04140 [Alphaproteobacteria bacterium]|nr:hypothetical protein [Alphaproteobacteria bacterium]